MRKLNKKIRAKNLLNHPQGYQNLLVEIAYQECSRWNHKLIQQWAEFLAFKKLNRSVLGLDHYIFKKP